MKKAYIAAAAALFMTTNAQAAVVVSNTTISLPNNFEGYFINFVTGATSTTQNNTFDFNPYSFNNTLSFYWAGDVSSNNGGVVTGAGTYRDLAPGAVISSASFFAASTGSHLTGDFRTTGDHILGVKFMNESTGLINYGYVMLNTTGNLGFPATITGWAYENTGAAITVAALAPAIPEPASWAMMIGGFGLIGAAMRRRSATVSFA